MRNFFLLLSALPAITYMCQPLAAAPCEKDFVGKIAKIGEKAAKADRPPMLFFVDVFALEKALSGREKLNSIYLFKEKADGLSEDASFEISDQKCVEAFGRKITLLKSSFPIPLKQQERTELQLKLQNNKFDVKLVIQRTPWSAYEWEKIFRSVFYNIGTLLSSERALKLVTKDELVGFDEVAVPGREYNKESFDLLYEKVFLTSDNGNILEFLDYLKSIEKNINEKNIFIYFLYDLNEERKDIYKGVTNYFTEIKNRFKFKPKYIIIHSEIISDHRLDYIKEISEQFHHFVDFISINDFSEDGRKIIDSLVAANDRRTENNELINEYLSKRFGHDVEVNRRFYADINQAISEPYFWFILNEQILRVDE